MFAVIAVRSGLAWLVSLLLLAFALQSPIGATFAAADQYVLPANVIVPNDLYVIANEVQIDGEVQGHVAVIARRAVISGTITGSTNLLVARSEVLGARLGVVRTIGALLQTPPTTPEPTSLTQPTVRMAAVAPSAGPQQISLADLPPQTITIPLLLLGFSLLSLSLLALAPRAVLTPATALAARPANALLVGLLTGQLFLLIPVGTIALALLINYFWTWFPATLLVVLIVAAAGLLWFFSPLVSGIWLGLVLNQHVGRTAHFRPGLVAGVLLIALLGQVPILGPIVYLVSFIIVLGAIVNAVGGALRRPLL